VRAQGISALDRERTERKCVERDDGERIAGCRLLVGEALVNGLGGHLQCRSLAPSFLFVEPGVLLIALDGVLEQALCAGAETGRESVAAKRPTAHLADLVRQELGIGQAATWPTHRLPLKSLMR
jgi:hypothetical protein